MTENEAIKILTEVKSWLSNDNTMEAFRMGIKALEEQSMINKILDETRKYASIGTVEEFEELKVKAYPMKPSYEGDGYAPDGTFIWDEWICLHCEARYEVDCDKYDYCPNCGQAIDWSE